MRLRGFLSFAAIIVILGAVAALRPRAQGERTLASSEKNLTSICRNVAEYDSRLDLELIQVDGQPMPQERTSIWGSAHVESCKDLSLSELGQADAVTIAAKALSCPAGILPTVPWALLESPRRENQKAAYRVMLGFARKMLKEQGKREPPGSDETAIQEVLEDLAAHGPGDLTESQRLFRENLQPPVDQSVTLGPQFGVRSPTYPGLIPNLVLDIPCEKYDAPLCSQALKDTFKRHPMTPSATGVPIGMPRLLYEFMGDALDARAMAIAALKIMRKIQAVEAGQSIDDHRLFEDIRDSYREAGADETDATDHAWRALGVYSMQGAAFHWFANLFTRDNAPQAAAIYVIAAGLGYLEGIALEHHSRYAFPSEVRSSCYYGKPYHFWNSGYLAREETQQIHDPRSSAAAIHLAGLAYAYNYKDFGRDGEYEKTLTDPDSVYIVSERLNTVFNDAGAIYGARSAMGVTQSSFDIDEAILHMSKWWRPRDRKFLATFLDWRESSAADIAFFRFLNGF